LKLTKFSVRRRFYLMSHSEGKGAYTEGVQAYYDGESLSDNPYSTIPEASERWDTGYWDAESGWVTLEDVGRFA
jgi:hypothetical protein